MSSCSVKRLIHHCIILAIKKKEMESVRVREGGRKRERGGGRKNERKRERERERERDRQTNRQTDRQTETETESARGDMGVATQVI